MLSPFNSLLKIASTVSKIGIANIVIGITNDVRVATLKPRRAIIDIINPKKRLPESPINIFAGGKLKTKKPRVLPNMIKDKIISKPPILFKTIAIILIVKKYILLIPPASPSNPSIKLIAFEIATIKNVDHI